MFLAGLFLKLILYLRLKAIVVCSKTQNKVLPMRQLIYSCLSNVIEKLKKKKQWNCRWERMSKVTEEIRLTVLIKRFLQEFCIYWYWNKMN